MAERQATQNSLSNICTIIELFVSLFIQFQDGAGILSIPEIPDSIRLDSRRQAVAQNCPMITAQKCPIYTLPTYTLPNKVVPTMYYHIKDHK